MLWFTCKVRFGTIPAGWVAGWLAGWLRTDNKSSSVQLELELGLELGKIGKLPIFWGTLKKNLSFCIWF
jgi:hypothetical protein